MAAPCAAAAKFLKSAGVAGGPAEKLKEERQKLYLMDSTRPNPTFLTAQIRPTTSGEAAYSSKKDLAFLQLDSDAGIAAGVFFSQPERRTPA